MKYVQKSVPVEAEQYVDARPASAGVHSAELVHAKDGVHYYVSVPDQRCRPLCWLRKDGDHSKALPFVFYELKVESREPVQPEHQYFQAQKVVDGWPDDVKSVAYYVETRHGRKYLSVGDWIVTDAVGTTMVVPDAEFQKAFESHVEP